MQRKIKEVAANMQHVSMTLVLSRVSGRGFIAPEADALPGCATRRNVSNYLILLNNSNKKQPTYNSTKMQRNAAKCALLKELLAAKVQQISHILGAGNVSLRSHESASYSNILSPISKNQNSLCGGVRSSTRVRETGTTARKSREYARNSRITNGPHNSQNRHERFSVSSRFRHESNLVNFNQRSANDKR